MAISYPPALENLIEQLHHLPGIGKKTAQRLAVFLLKDSDEYSHLLSQAILSVKEEIKLCKVCFNITESEICEICAHLRRDKSTICVVEDIVDIFAIEKSHEYYGVYHVLGGVISPLNGVLPEDLRLNELIERSEQPEVN